MAREPTPARDRAIVARRDEQPYPVIATRVDPRVATSSAPTHDGEPRRGRRSCARRSPRRRVGGGEKYTSRHKAAGKLLPRERIELLLDRDSYFLELCPLAGKDVPGHTPGAGFIGGIGRVSGVECLITASESTVKGGAISEMTRVEVGPAVATSPSRTGCRRSR